MTSHLRSSIVELSYPSIKMGDFPTVITEAKVDTLHSVIQNGRQKFLCFTRLAGDVWVVSVTDGLDAWRLEMGQDELDSHVDLAGVSSPDIFLTRFRNAFATGDIFVAKIGNKVTLTLGKGSNTLEIDLFEAKSTEKKVEMQLMLFRLAESASSLEKQLEAANGKIEQLKAQKVAAGASGGSSLFDTSPKKGANAAKTRPRKEGMSLINPTSKKRKTAKGVVFE